MTEWIIRLTNDTTEYKTADTWQNERGMLVLYDDEGRVVIAYAVGVWRAIERKSRQ
jgi:hypothetical protein